MEILLGTFCLFIIGYTLVNVINHLIWSVGGLLGKADDVSIDSTPTRLRRILVLVPAYKEDRVILDSIKSNLKQNYPDHLYDLMVIADSFKTETLSQLNKLPIKVLEVSFVVSSVNKALNAALNCFTSENYDVVVIADADNHMAPDFLERINAAFDAGWKVVQGHRVAKNLNTSVAILDAISEEVNNHIFRKGHRAFGFSSSLIGSGMAFEFNILKKNISQIQVISGYDKELEMKILKEKIPIAYLEKAYIFDEKVQTPRMFEYQRTRWVEAQIQQANTHVRQGFEQLLNKNYDYAEKAFQTLALPRILTLGLLVISLLVSLSLNNIWYAKIMAVQLLLYVITLGIALPAYLRRRIGINEILMIPVLFFRFVRSVINYRRAKGKFLHTTHGTDSKAVI